MELGPEAFWLVVMLGAFSGAISVQFVNRWSNAEKLRSSVNRIWAHLLELQLFAEEPRLILQAQRDLLIANGVMLRLMVVPLLILSGPFAMLLVGADAIFGRAPLRVGEATVVTGRFSGSAPNTARMETPPGILKETPPVVIPIESEVSWRVRANRPLSGDLQITAGERVFRKSISSRPGLQWLSERRFGLPFSAAGVKFIEVRYPPATVFHLHWLIWFSVASMLGAGISALRAGTPSAAGGFPR